MKNPADKYMTDSSTTSVLTRTELAMVRAAEAFTRWVTVLNNEVGPAGLSYPDIALLHSIRMHGGARNLSELLMFLNRKDVSTIQYALRKLEQNELVERVSGGSKREAGYKLTPTGLKVTEAYAKIRNATLRPLIEEVVEFEAALESAAKALERMTGIYDQATQEVLNRHILM